MGGFQESPPVLINLLRTVVGFVLGLSRFLLSMALSLLCRHDGLRSSSSGVSRALGRL